MSLLARRKRAPASYFDPREDDALESPFYPGERICPPPANTRGNPLLRVCILLLIVAGGWWLLRHPESWQGSLSTKLATASALIDGGETGPLEPATAAPVHADAAEAASQVDTASLQSPSDSAAGDDATPPPTQPLTMVATAPADEGFSSSPLPPPASDPADPYQTRAVAAGLPPDLSRALLSRLSPTDYRNARIAIETALAKTPDSGTFVWPRQRRPELALFEVRFVRGAATGCRRYVVTVTKDRWSTTAPPMEKCGSSLARRSQ